MKPTKNKSTTMRSSIPPRWPNLATIAALVLAIGSAVIATTTPTFAQRLGSDSRIKKLEQHVASLRSQVNALREVVVISASTVALKAKNVKLEATEGDVTLKAADDIVVTASDDVSWNSGDNIGFTASRFEVNSSTVNVNAGMATYSGVLKSDTLITNSVVSSSYTPGAGNIW